MPTILTLEKLSKRFGAIVAVDGIDLTLLRGELLGIIGRNGMGKTTLFDLITGAVPADRGRIVFEGHDITRMKREHRCRMGVARSFQVPQPFNRMTVFENLVLAAAFGGGRSEADVYDGCAGLLERFDLLDKANGSTGSLTPFERKRLDLARALATGPRVLLLDEIAAGLKERETDALVELIHDLRATGVSIIWAEHTAHALVAVADRLLVLQDGAFIAEGDPAEVIRRPEVTEVELGIEERRSGLYA